MDLPRSTMRQPSWSSPPIARKVYTLVELPRKYTAVTAKITEVYIHAVSKDAPNMRIRAALMDLPRSTTRPVAPCISENNSRGRGRGSPRGAPRPTTPLVDDAPTGPHLRPSRPRLPLGPSSTVAVTNARHAEQTVRPIVSVMQSGRRMKRWTSGTRVRHVDRPPPDFHAALEQQPRRRGK
jgi:hypothetical protein